MADGAILRHALYTGQSVVHRGDPIFVVSRLSSLLPPLITTFVNAVQGWEMAEAFAYDGAVVNKGDVTDKWGGFQSVVCFGLE